MEEETLERLGVNIEMMEELWCSQYEEDYRRWIKP